MSLDPRHYFLPYGRARRLEFLMVFGVAIVASVATARIAKDSPWAAVGSTLTVLYLVATAWARRMHDVGLTAKWLMLPYALLSLAVGLQALGDGNVLSSALTSLLTMVVLAAMGVLVWPGQAGANRYGPDPRRTMLPSVAVPAAVELPGDL